MATSGLLYWIGGGVTGIAFLLLLSSVFRRPQQRRLSATERQETLLRIRQWIETPERAP
jgi:hypothetical protein